jgi:hypothetical protein
MLAEPIAGSFDLDDDGVVEQTIEERGGDDGITEDRRVLQSSAGSFLTLRLRIRGTHCLAIGLRS